MLVTHLKRIILIYINNHISSKPDWGRQKTKRVLKMVVFVLKWCHKRFKTGLDRTGCKVNITIRRSIEEHLEPDFHDSLNFIDHAKVIFNQL